MVIYFHLLRTNLSIVANKLSIILKISVASTMVNLPNNERSTVVTDESESTATKADVVRIIIMIIFFILTIYSAAVSL